MKSVLNRFCIKPLTILSIVSLVASPVFCQHYESFERKIDSLKSVLTESTGLKKADILFQLGYEYLRINDTIALPYSDVAFKLSWQFGDSLRIVKAGRAKAMILNELVQFDSVIALSEIMLPIARRNNYTGEMKYLLNLLAVAHTFKANYDKALTYNLESLELRKKYEDSLSISIAYNNTGLVYYKMSNYDKALYCFEKSLELWKPKDGSPSETDDFYASSFLNISLCYSYMNDVVKAEHYLLRAYNLCGNGCEHLHLINYHFAAGILNLKRGYLAKAKAEFAESYFLAKETSNVRFELDNLVYLADIEFKSGQFKQAEHYLLEAEQLDNEWMPFNRERAKIYKQLFEVYSRLKDYVRVAIYQSKYITLKENIFNEELTANLMRIEADYLQREHNAKIEAQGKILALNNDIIKRQRLLSIVIGIVALLSIAFVFVLMQNVRQKRRINLLFEKKVKERTIELETNHLALLKTVEEHIQQMKRVSAEVKSSMATIKGLCKLSLQDANVVNAGQYIDKIERASDSLQTGIFRTLGINEDGAS